jgi:hypothetical protein
MSTIPYPEMPQSIPGDRRANRRYAVALKLRYTVIRGKRVLDTGNGITIDMSSGGISFTCDRVLQRGAVAELHIEWPFLLQNAHRLKLVIAGRIVRSGAREAVVRSSRHEFHVTGAQAAPPPELLAGMPVFGKRN